MAGPPQILKTRLVLGLCECTCENGCVCACVCEFVCECVIVWESECERECVCVCVLQSIYVWSTATISDTWLTRAQEGAKMLTYAIDKDNADILKALLARGADPNSKNTVCAGVGVERVYKSVKGGGGCFHLLHGWCPVTNTHIMVYSLTGRRHPTHIRCWRGQGSQCKGAHWWRGRHRFWKHG